MKPLVSLSNSCTWLFALAMMFAACADGSDDVIASTTGASTDTGTGPDTGVTGAESSTTTMASNSSSSGSSGTGSSGTGSSSSGSSTSDSSSDSTESSSTADTSSSTSDASSSSDTTGDPSSEDSEESSNTSDETGTESGTTGDADDDDDTLSELEAWSCDLLPNLVSPDDGDRTRVTFINNSGKKRRIFHVNDDGEHLPEGTVNADDQLRVRARVDEVWYVADPQDGCIGVYFPTEEDSKVTLE